LPLLTRIRLAARKLAEKADTPMGNDTTMWKIFQDHPNYIHSYSPGRFIDEYAGIATSDLFLRDDSRRLHAHELTLA